MVQIEAPRTPECQKAIPSQGGQCMEEHRVVHHVQEEVFPCSPSMPWLSILFKWPIKMCLCDCESPVGNPLHNSKFKFRACPYRPHRSIYALKSYWIAKMDWKMFCSIFECLILTGPRPSTGTWLGRRLTALCPDKQSAATTARSVESNHLGKLSSLSNILFTLWRINLGR